MLYSSPNRPPLLSADHKAVFLWKFTTSPHDHCRNEALLCGIWHQVFWSCLFGDESSRWPQVRPLYWLWTWPLFIMTLNTCELCFIVIQEFCVVPEAPAMCTVLYFFFIYLFFYVSQTVVVETEVSLCRLLATWTLFDTLWGWRALKTLPTLCQPSQKLTGGWSGKTHSRLVSNWFLGCAQFHLEGRGEQRNTGLLVHLMHLSGMVWL